MSGLFYFAKGSEELRVTHGSKAGERFIFTLIHELTIFDEESFGYAGGKGGGPGVF